MNAKCSEEKAHKHSALVELIAAENNANFCYRNANSEEVSGSHSNIDKPIKTFCFLSQLKRSEDISPDILPYLFTVFILSLVCFSLSLVFSNDFKLPFIKAFFLLGNPGLIDFCVPSLLNTFSTPIFVIKLSGLANAHE